jgi:hypothetical protein
VLPCAPTFSAAAPTPFCNGPHGTDTNKFAASSLRRTPSCDALPAAPGPALPTPSPSRAHARSNHACVCRTCARVRAGTVPRAHPPCALSDALGHKHAWFGFEGSALKVHLRSNCTQSSSRHAASYTANRLLEMLDRNMKIKRAPERSHICAGTGPHLHRDRPTSAPGLCCCAHRALQHRCLKGHSVP